MIEIEMVQIPAGWFATELLNAQDFLYPIEETGNMVRLQTFAIGKHLVTQAQYQAVMESNPSFLKGVNRPVENVSWCKAVEFCEKLSEQSGIKYRLPTEAEWGYACEAATETIFSFDSPVSKTQVNFNSDSTAHDMYTNTYEWCQDKWKDAPMRNPNLRDWTEPCNQYSRVGFRVVRS
jgi:formylglycine-generating enzyme required for sulfatase activity